MSKPKPATQSKLDQLLAKSDQRRQKKKTPTWLDLLSKEDRELFEQARNVYQGNKSKYRASDLSEELAKLIETDASTKTIAMYLGARGNG